MTQFQLHDIDTAPSVPREMLARASGSGSEVPNLVRMLAESPAALAGFQQLREAFTASGLTSLEQEVVYLTVAKTNACHYCIAQGGMFDISPDSIAVGDAIRGDRPIADARLQALRRFTAAMTEQRGWVSDEAVGRFMAAGFGREQVLDVICGIALATMSSYSNHVAATPIDAPGVIQN